MYVHPMQPCLENMDLQPAIPFRMIPGNSGTNAPGLRPCDVCFKPDSLYITEMVLDKKDKPKHLELSGRANGQLMTNIIIIHMSLYTSSWLCAIDSDITNSTSCCHFRLWGHTCQGSNHKPVDVNVETTKHLILWWVSQHCIHIYIYIYIYSIKLCYSKMTLQQQFIMWFQT